MKKNSKSLEPAKLNGGWEEIVLTDDQIELLNLQHQFFDGDCWYIFLVPAIIKVDGEKTYLTDNMNIVNSKVKSWYRHVLKEILKK